MIEAELPLGLAIGLAVGMLGGGGSMLALPVLVYVLGQGVHEATTASLVIVTAGALAGSIRHRQAGHVCWRHAAVFTTAALPGIAAGTMAGESVSGPMLIAAFAGLMLTAAASMWRRGGQAPGPVTGRSRPVCPPLNMLLDVAAGLAIGFVTGFLGVGGGFLVVPALAIALGFSMRLAVGTSLAIITITSLLGLGAHLVAGRGLDVSGTIAMAAACAAGAFLGADLSGRIPQRRLARGFAVVIAGVAGYLLVSAALLGGPSGS